MEKTTEKQIAAQSQEVAQKPRNPLKAMFENIDVRKKFEDMLGKRAAQFMTSVLQIAASNKMLAKADPMSIMNAAAVAATLDLPLNNNLGFAYIVPYNERQPDNSYKTVAQFQMGYKGYKQLAIRTGLFKTIHCTDVREGEIRSHNRLSGVIEFDWIQNEEERERAKIIGYVSYFALTTGYEQTFYMAKDKVKWHGEKYSKTFNNKNGRWSLDFDGMALKTVIKLNLSKNAPLSVEMRTAIEADQSKVTEDGDYVYIDNEETDINKEAERIRLMIEQATEPKHLEILAGDAAEHDLLELLEEKRNELTGEGDK